MLIGLLAQYLAHTVVASHRQTDAAIDCNFFPWAHSQFVVAVVNGHHQASVDRRR